MLTSYEQVTNMRGFERKHTGQMCPDRLKAYWSNVPCIVVKCSAWFQLLTSMLLTFDQYHYIEPILYKTYTI